MLKGLHLNAEDLGFEFPLMHHHSFVLGDLNYRLTHRSASPNEILELVSNVHRSEASAMNAATNGSGTTTSTSSTGLGSMARKRWSSWRTGFLSDSGLLRSGRTNSTESTSVDVSRLERHVKSTGASETNVVDHDDTHDRDSSASLDEFERIDEKFIWEDVLLHDELKSWMDAAQIFYGFREGRIAFPPSYRRKRGMSLKPDAKWTLPELAKQYTTTIKGAGDRVPSYTDRILFASQRDLTSRLKCSLYTLCEEVKCSDHKPVVAVFHARVNRMIEPMPQRSLPPLPLRKWRRMQNIAGVYECTLRIDFSAIRWKEHPAYFAMLEREQGNATHTSDASNPRQYDTGEKRLNQGTRCYLPGTCLILCNGLTLVSQCVQRS